MRLYYEDACETSEPWKRWECQRSDGNQKVWVTLTCSPRWDTDYAYRRKPRTIKIGEYDVPEPCRTPLELKTKYWGVSLAGIGNHAYTWYNDTFDNRCLEAGIVHLSEEAAEIHRNALLSFTAKQP